MCAWVTVCVSVCVSDFVCVCVCVCVSVCVCVVLSVPILCVHVFIVCGLVIDFVTCFLFLCEEAVPLYEPANHRAVWCHGGQ